MKMKLYYRALALMWLLSSCSVDNDMKATKISALGVSEYVFEGHTYIKKGYGMAHAGHCLQCKHELDSIVKNAVNEAFEATMREDWNE